MKTERYLTNIHIFLAKYRPIVLVIVLTVIVMVFENIIVFFYNQNVVPTPIPVLIPKQVGAISLPLKEIWRQSVLVTVGDDDPPKLLLQDKVIILAVEDKHASNQRTIAIDCQTGNLIWKTDPIFKRPYSLIADETRIYLGYNNYVEALDLKTGQRVWQGLQQSDWKKGNLNVYIRDKQLEVYDQDTKDFPLNTKLWILDPSNGKTLNQLEIPGIFFQDANKYYLSSAFGGGLAAGLIAEDKMTGHELWLLNTTGRVKRWPIIINDIMYLDAGDMYAINTNNGDVQWLYKDADIPIPEKTDIHGQYANLLISKIAYSKNILYFVKSDGTIVGLNPDTGQEIGKIEITPPSVFYDDEGFLRQDIYYLIAASDNYVAAYYGDSQELIVFERTDVAP